MFPLRDHAPTGGPAYVTWALIALNCVLYAMTAQWGGDMHEFWSDHALWPVQVAQGTHLSGLASYMFLHAGILHLAGNMVVLWVFGDNLEGQLGHGVFLLFYLACGWVAGLAQVMVDPSVSVPVIGASGAVAGVMGGYLLLFPRARVDVLFFFVLLYTIWTVPAWAFLGVWFALQIGSQTLWEGPSGTAYMAHISGFIMGVGLCLPLWLVLGGPRYWRNSAPLRKGAAPAPTATLDAAPAPGAGRSIFTQFKER